jgi:hypothetical protein
MKPTALSPRMRAYGPEGALNNHGADWRMKWAQLAAAGLIFLAAIITGCSTSSDSLSTETAAVRPAFVLTKTAGADSDTSPIARPSLHSGDVWIDRIQGADRDFRIETIDDGTMNVNFWGAEMTTDTALNIIVYRSLTEASSEPTKSSKPGMWFGFPLYPGKTWDNKYDWETMGAAPVQGKAEDHGKVLSWEDVRVPAGTFHALKVEVTSRYYGQGGMADEETLVYWYSPRVNRFVKFDYRSVYEGELLAELISYKPSTQ